MQWFVATCVEPSTRIKPVAAPPTQRERQAAERLDPSPPSAEEVQAADDERQMQNAMVEHAREVMHLFEHAIEEVEVVRAEVRIIEDQQRRENQEAQALGRNGRRRARVR
jgi:hypothetical protein